LTTSCDSVASNSPSPNGTDSADPTTTRAPRHFGPSRLDERLRRVDPGDVLGSEHLGEEFDQRTGAAADIQSPLSLAHSSGVAHRDRERRTVSADEPVVGLGWGLEHEAAIGQAEDCFNLVAKPAHRTLVRLRVLG
jgi:hypothetical protein